MTDKLGMGSKVGVDAAARAPVESGASASVQAANYGSDAAARLARAVNDAADRIVPSAYVWGCTTQDVADVLEQRQELLEALRNVLGLAENYIEASLSTASKDPDIIKARAAIAKATGAK